MPRTMDPFFGDGIPGLQPILIHGIWDHNIGAGFGMDFFTCFHTSGGHIGPSLVVLFFS